jgi:hypothetical protein
VGGTCISYQQFRARLRWQWDEWSAAIVPLRDINGLREHAFRMREMRRKYLLDLVELAEKNGISYPCFRYRASKGWDYTLAAIKPVSPFNGANRVKELYGENYFKILRKWLFIKTKK